MSGPEYYANPGRNLDTDDHERLLDENRDAYLRERHERLVRELEHLERRMGQ
jgi:hypothetical protein